MKPAVILLACAVAAVAVSGCSSFRRAVGAERAVPDEFAVVAKAPLVIPPEYSLVPPRPGEARPQELNSSATARQALFGVVSDADQSQGEQALVAEAGGQLANPNIRAQIEQESAGVVFKSEGFADRILFWRGGDNYGLGADALDADAEAERLRREEAVMNTTGGAEVEIERNRSTGLKLPGL